MSVITLFYGQCGSQISEAFYSNIYDDFSNSKKDSEYYTQTLNKWFQVTKTNKWEPRSVLIDTELKTLSVRNNFRHQIKKVVSKSSGGSANNWTFGYYEQSKFLKDEVLECVRKELEKNDSPCSFLNIFSSSGGTGAGVGSCIIENLKNEFPNTAITNAVVLPYTDGELVTQSYNSLLALAKIYSFSDSIILFENDRLHYNCTNSLNIKDVNFSNINNLIVRQLLSIYQPLKDVQTQDLLTKLCEDRLKFLQIRLAPLSNLESASNWKSLLTSISRQSRFDFTQRSQTKVQLKPKSLSTALVCRGVHSPTEKDLKPFKDSHASKTVQVYHHKRKFFGLENCFSVVSNSNNVVVPVGSILQDAWNLYRYGAYIHHYKKFGVDEAYFKSCFEIVENVLGDYKKL